MMPRSPTEEDFPAAYVTADTSSNSAQKKFKRAIGWRLRLLVLAGIFGAFTLEGGWDVLSSVLGAGCFIGAIVIELYIWKGGAEQTWYRARAAAESAKTLAWRYAVGGEPFGKGDPADPEFLLTRQMQEITSVLSEIDMAATIGTGELVTTWMRETRGAPLPVRKAIYKRDRIEDQQRWYEKTGRRHKEALDRWTRYLFVAEILGVGGALLSVATDLPIDMLGIAAAAAAALAAWVQTGQYRTLQTAYLVTALELASVRQAVPDTEDEKEWSQFVEEAEKAFSREHTLWKASRGVQSL